MITLDNIKEIICKQLNKKPEDISLEKEIVKDLGADSLDIVEMLLNFEEQYNISIPEEDAGNIKTVGDIINLINK